MGTPTGFAGKSDTSLEAERVRVKALRGLGQEGRARMTLSITDSLRSRAAFGIRHRHPDYDANAVRIALVRLYLGDDLFRLVHPGVEVAP